MRLSGWSLCFLCLAGCMGDSLDLEFDFDFTGWCRRGELHRACLQVASPMAAGAEFYMNVSQIPEDAFLQSTAPTVAVIESVERLGERQRYTVRAVHRGTARLEVRTADGAIFDWVELEVRDPAVLRLPTEWCSPGPQEPSTDTLRLTVGDRCYLMPEVLDGQGEVLDAGLAPVWHPTHPVPAQGFFHNEADLLDHGPVAVGTLSSIIRLDAVEEGSTFVGCSVGRVFGARTIVVTDPDPSPSEDD
jgi:hypothetical protein